MIKSRKAIVILCLMLLALPAFAGSTVTVDFVLADVVNAFADAAIKTADEIQEITSSLDRTANAIGHLVDDSRLQVPSYRDTVTESSKNGFGINGLLDDKTAGNAYPDRYPDIHDNIDVREIKMGKLSNGTYYDANGIYRLTVNGRKVNLDIYRDVFIPSRYGRLSRIKEYIGTLSGTIDQYWDYENGFTDIEFYNIDIDFHSSNMDGMYRNLIECYSGKFRLHIDKATANIDITRYDVESRSITSGTIVQFMESDDSYRQEQSLLLGTSWIKK